MTDSGRCCYTVLHLASWKANHEFFYRFVNTKGRLKMNIQFYQYRDSYYNDKTVSRQSYSYNWNHYTWKNGLYIEKKCPDGDNYFYNNNVDEYFLWIENRATYAYEYKFKEIDVNITETQIWVGLYRHKSLPHYVRYAIRWYQNIDISHRRGLNVGCNVGWCIPVIC